MVETKEKNSEQYVKDCLKTLSMDMPEIKNRLNVDSTIHMLHAVMGIATEAGELLDMLKKHIFYGKELDLVNLEEELGDSDWYQSLAIHSACLKGHHTSWEAIWDKNIAKLKSRYGDKFSEERAEERDLEKEREILEGGYKSSIIVEGKYFLISYNGANFYVLNREGEVLANGQIEEVGGDRVVKWAGNKTDLVPRLELEISILDESARLKRTTKKEKEKEK